MNILFIGPISRVEAAHAGYGNAAAGIASVLIQMERENRIDNVYFYDTNSELFDRPLSDKIDVSICVANPQVFINNHPKGEQIKKVILLGEQRYLSIVWETTPIPDRWKDIFDGDLFTGILSPSKFVAREIEGVLPRSVYYYPHFIDISKSTPINIDNKVKHEDVFTVLFVGQYTKRKSIDEAIIAFTKAMYRCPNAQLILKTHILGTPDMDINKLIKLHVNTNAPKMHAKIYNIMDTIDESEMYDLYRQASMLLFPSKGEGFGLPPAEAMGVGLPVAYTDWSSLPEVAQGPGNIAIDYKLDLVQGMDQYGYEVESMYAYPSIQDISTAIKLNYAAWSQDIQKYYEVTKGNRNIIDGRFGYDTVSRCLEHIINHEDGFAPTDIEDSLNLRCGSDIPHAK